MHFHVIQAYGKEIPAILFSVGTVFWIVALLQMIRVGFRDRAPAMPLAAICSNITYQFYFGFICPAVDCAICPYGSTCTPDAGLHGAAMLWTWRVWFVLQLLIVYQLFRWGTKRRHEVPLPASMVRPMAIVLLLLFYFGQASYVKFYTDFEGNAVTYLSNLMMSVLFIPLLYARPGLEGLSYGAAWNKMLGSGLQAVAVVLTLHKAFPSHQGSFGLIYLIFGGILLFDLWYVVLFHRRRGAGEPAAAA